MVPQLLGDRGDVVGDVAELVGKPVQKFEIDRTPTTWWERPVRIGAQVGEHSDVTWKFVN